LRIIFGDCLLTDTLLDMIGLSESSTRIFWDHFHLQSFVWPTAMGKDLYDRIAHDAIAMMNSQSAATKKKTAACGFCGEDDGHNINGCTRRTDNGRRHHVLCGEEYNCVVSVLAQGTVAVPLPSELKETKKLLDSIPPRTKWLVIKGVYHNLISANGIPPMDSTIVHVDCLGTGGQPLSEEEYCDCLVRMLGAHCWIGKSGKNGTKVLSSILIDRTNPSLSESLLQKACCVISAV